MVLIVLRCLVFQCFYVGTVLGIGAHARNKKPWNENLRLVKRSCILHVFIMYLLFWNEDLHTYLENYGDMYWCIGDLLIQDCVYTLWWKSPYHKLVYDMMSDSCRTFFLSFEDLPSENGYDIVLILKETLPTKCPDISFESAFSRFSLIISVYPNSSWTAEGHWTIGYTPRYVQCIMLYNIWG